MDATKPNVSTDASGNNDSSCQCLIKKAFSIERDFTRREKEKQYQIKLALQKLRKKSKRNQRLKRETKREKISFYLFIF